MTEIKGFWTGDSNLRPSSKNTWPWASPNFSQLRIPSLWVRMLSTSHSYYTGLQIQWQIWKMLCKQKLTFTWAISFMKLYLILFPAVCDLSSFYTVNHHKVKKKIVVHWVLACTSSWFLNVGPYYVRPIDLSANVECVTVLSNVGSHWPLYPLYAQKWPLLLRNDAYFVFAFSQFKF